MEGERKSEEIKLEIGNCWTIGIVENGQILERLGIVGQTLTRYCMQGPQRASY